MAGISKIIAVVLLIVGLVIAGIGGYIMFILVPNAIEGQTFPDDFDDHFVYGGYMRMLNTTSGDYEKTGFTVDRHIRVEEKLEGGQLRIDERITAVVNGTDKEIPTLDKHNNYQVDEKDLVISYVTNNEGYEEYYDEGDDVNWIFPHPVDKDKDYNIWNMNILNHSEAIYEGKEERGGVDCYVFYGEEPSGGKDVYYIPLPQSLIDDFNANGIGFLVSGTKMRIELWERAWVHPSTGTIVDYAKEIKQYLELPELTTVLPNVVYPPDFTSTTGFEGNVVMFSMETGQFVPIDGIKAERTITVTNTSGTLRTATEEVQVTTSGGTPLPDLGSVMEVIFNSTTAAHEGNERTGQYLFPPTGVLMQNYSLWEEGYQREVRAVYSGMDPTSFAPFTAYVFEVHENDTYYKQGMEYGTASLDMTYWVEPHTGIVLDVIKDQKVWLDLDARRLPLDTGDINKTVNLNTTVTTINPISMEEDSMELLAVQTINCSGYADAMFTIAKIEEKVERLLPDGTPAAAPVVSRFGVNAYTMEYEDVDGWSTVTRAGHFTFPVGLLNGTGDVIPSFTMYNPDLGISIPTVLTEELEYNGLEAAEYAMVVSEQPTPIAAVEEMTEQEIPIPGATATYNCDYRYIVHIDTGTILNIMRNMHITIYPPTYEYIYDNLNSTTVLKGQFMGDNVAITQNLMGEDWNEGTANISVTKTFLYDNGTPFKGEETGVASIDVHTHEMLYPNGSGMGVYMLFPPDPTSSVSYNMMFMFGDDAVMGPAELTSQNDLTCNYTWNETAPVDGGIFNPAWAGLELNLTMAYDWMLDMVTGSVLDASLTMSIMNASLMVDLTSKFVTNGTGRESLALNNRVIGWALSGHGVNVLDAEIDLAEEDAAYASAKAPALSNSLLVADGKRPALDLSLSFNGTTKANMMESTYSLMGLLTLYSNVQTNGELAAHVYYEQVDEDVNENKGSVEYWGDFAREKQDYIDLMGTTVPLVLYVIGLILVLVAIVLFVVKPGKGEPEEEGAAEEEDPGEEDEEEGAEGEEEPEEEGGLDEEEADEDEEGSEGEDDEEDEPGEDEDLDEEETVEEEI